MIQRIQTLFLLLAAVLLAFVFYAPFAVIIDQANQMYVFTFKGFIFQSSGLLLVKTLPVGVLAIIAMVDLVMIIFLYKKRVQQMRLCFAAIGMLLLMQAFVVYYLNAIDKQFAGAVMYKLTIIIPLISAILTFLAYRGIKKDEMLVRSLDRIR